MSLNDPMFYLELVGHCLNEAAHCDSPSAARGLHKLAQSYLEMAESVHAGNIAGAVPAAMAQAA
ncbi:MAG: hypothetical protein AB7K04_05140 [Pseudorhodoplanes sp.]